MQNKLQHKIKKFLSVTKVHTSLVSANCSEELEQLSSNLERNIQSASEEGRNLKIAVVGQMKAGKSSFLNALLFPVDLLPKAATPMTAALTRIAYGDTLRAEIEFYSKADWELITKRAAEYQQQYREIEQALMSPKDEKKPTFSFGRSKPTPSAVKPSPAMIQSQISDELRSCHELLEMSHNLPLDHYLGKTEQLEAGSIAELSEALKNYVGSQGRFTAITKMFSLYINDERLKDFEIYDTPGFNDPVVSRGMQTRKFLGQCDVVFLLSNINQFLTKSDISLLREQLTAAGIDSKAVFLVGSQRDLVFRMDRTITQQAQLMAQQHPEAQRAQAAIAAMMHLLDRKMLEMSQSSIGQHLNNPAIDEASKSILTAIQANKPLLVSSLCWRMAEHLHQMPDDLAEQYQALSRDTKFEFDADQLKEFSNIAPINVLMQEQRQRKNELVQVKISNLIEGTSQRVQAIHQDLLASIDQRLNQLQSSSVEQLKRQRLLIEKNLQQGQNQIDHALQQEINKIQTKLNILTRQLKAEQQEFSQVATLERRDVRIEKKEKAGFWAGLARAFDLGGYSHDKIEIVTPYARVQDSIEKIKLFANGATQKLEKELRTIVDMNELRTNIAVAAISLFDTSDPDFDVLSFKVQVEQCLKQYKEPRLSLSANSFIDGIVEIFGLGEVKSEDIQQLASAHQRAIADVCLRVMSLVEKSSKDLDLYFKEMHENLIQNLIYGIQQDLSTLIDQINHKQDTQQKLLAYKKAIQELS